MAGFRTQVDIHHIDDQADGKDWMLVLNGWCVWRLTDDEARQMSADLLMKLAYARAVETRDRRAVPFAEWAAEQEQRMVEAVF